MSTTPVTMQNNEVDRVELERAAAVTKKFAKALAKAFATYDHNRTTVFEENVAILHDRNDPQNVVDTFWELVVLSAVLSSGIGLFEDPARRGK